MPLLHLAPVLLALIVIGAHFLRASQWVALAAIVASLALLALRRGWVPRVLQLVLVLSALEWLRTLAELVPMRQSLGLPWHRLAAILGGVALATLATALAFRTRRLRDYYLSTTARPHATEAPGSANDPPR